MKIIIKYISVVFAVILLNSCCDRDILDHKDFNYSLPKVENLNCTKTGNNVRLTWQIPANISADFQRPVEVSIQIIENNIYTQIVTVLDEGTTADITIDSEKDYRFIVKLLGYLIDEAKEVGRPERVYSDGQIVEAQ